MNARILSRILRLAARAVAASAGGFSPAEIRELSAALIELGADVLAALPEREG